jgi:hypothetical protein
MYSAHVQWYAASVATIPRCALSDIVPIIRKVVGVSDDEADQQYNPQ